MNVTLSRWGIVAIGVIVACSSTLADDRSVCGNIPSPCYQAAILMEASTGHILHEEHAHKKRPPASLVKMMLMLLVVENVEAGHIGWTDSVKVSAAASRIGGAQVYLKQGEVFPLEELMKAIAIRSANDAAYAVAEYVSGSVQDFVKIMNERAGELNMADTHYYNVHGLPPRQDQEGNVTSAYDCTLLARELLKYPKVLEWTSTQRTTFRNGNSVLKNTNALIGSFPGADGLKTGFSLSSGFNMVATAEREGTRLVAVVLGAPTSQIRFAEARQLLSNGFDICKSASEDLR